MSEYYAKVEVVEQEGAEFNHLFYLVYHGKEYLISWTGDTQIGLPGTKVWVTWSALQCKEVQTVEQSGRVFVAGRVKLCTASNLEKST
jgi:hypothetical protein